MQSKKKTILAVAALVVIAAVLLLVWRAVTPKGEAGEKTITVQVLHKGGEERVFTLETGEAYLGAVLTAEGVVEDNQGPYGLYADRGRRDRGRGGTGVVEADQGRRNGQQQR